VGAALWDHLGSPHSEAPLARHHRLTAPAAATSCIIANASTSQTSLAPLSLADAHTRTPPPVPQFIVKFLHENYPNEVGDLGGAGNSL
jgi:hypothetical protein